MHTRLLLSILLAALLSGCTLLESSSPVPPSPEEHPYRSVVELAEARFLHAYGMAQLLAADGDEAGAVAALENALAAGDAPTPLRLTLAGLYLRQDQADRARQLVEEALRSDPRSIDACLFLGNFHAQRGEHQQAVSYFRQAVALDPERESSQLHLALSVARAETPENAIAVLQSYQQRHAESVMSAVTLSRLYREMGQSVQAETVLQQLLARRPDLDVPHLELGGVYEERGDIEKALDYYRQGRELNPGNFAVRHYIARLLINRQRLDEALLELQAIATLNPDDLEARRKIGLIHLERREWDAAAKAFRTILDSDPALMQVRYYLGSALEGKGDLDAALEAFALVTADSDLFEEALLHRAMLLHQGRRTDEGIKLLEEQLQGDVERPELFLYLAALYQDHNQPGMVLNTYDRGMERFPQNTELPYRKGLALELRGLHEAALEQMRGVLAMQAEHAEALNFIAYSYADSGIRLDEAMQLARKAIGLKREGHIVDTLGWIYYRLGRFREARTELEAAAKLMPEDAVVQEHLGDVYRALRLYKLAAQRYRRSLELLPDNPKVREKLHALPLH